MVLAMLSASVAIKAQPTSYDITSVDSLQLKGARDVLFFVYTDWCRFCTAMKQTTFKDDSVTHLLNQHFYFVPFNAESKNSVTISGKQYRFVPTGAGTGVHQLAAALSGQSASLFPLIAIINGKGEILFISNSYLNVKELIAVLNHVLEQRQLQ